MSGTNFVPREIISRGTNFVPIFVPREIISRGTNFVLILYHVKLFHVVLILYQT